MPGASIVSRDWNDVAEGKPPTLTPLGTSPQGQVLHEPLRGWASFSATFRVMFKEEGRKSIEFAKKRQSEAKQKARSEASHQNILNLYF